MNKFDMNRPKIAHFGAFDHDSYGDLIFPLIVEHMLPGFDFTHVSPTGNTTPWPDAKQTISVAEAFSRDDWDGVLVGGGDIIQSGEWATKNWAQTPLLKLGALPSLWCGASLLAEKLNIPCAWNCPGVPRDIPTNILSIALEALQSVDYLCLRDKVSAEKLNKLLIRPAFVAPDTALCISELWPIHEANITEKVKPLVLSLMTRDASERWHEVEVMLNMVSTQSNFSGEVIILPLMGWQSDSGLLTQKLESKGFTVTIRDRSLSLEKCALEISNSHAYVGNSLHGLITALSYGVPGVLVKPLGCEKNTKYAGFAEHFSPNSQLIANNFIEAANILASRHLVNIKNASNKLRDHLIRVENTLLHKQKNDKTKFWQKINESNCLESERMLFHALNVQVIMTKCIDLESQISSLNQAVVERDSQITNLNQAVAERDGQITNLNQAVAERDGQITNLNQAVAERDDAIVKVWHLLKK